MVDVRQPHGEICSISKQAFQHARKHNLQNLCSCTRRSHRQSPGAMTCASSSVLAQSATGNSSADQDMFLIAGAGIAGLVSAFSHNTLLQYNIFSLQCCQGNQACGSDAGYGCCTHQGVLLHSLWHQPKGTQKLLHDIACLSGNHTMSTKCHAVSRVRH